MRINHQDKKIYIWNNIFLYRKNLLLLLLLLGEIEREGGWDFLQKYKFFFFPFKRYKFEFYCSYLIEEYIGEKKEEDGMNFCIN